MGTTSFPETPQNADLQKVIINLNTIAEELDHVLSNIDTKNVREIAGWIASRYKLQSKDGDVGFNTQDTAADDIRIWAGDVMNGNPNFKVTKAGILTAVAAILMSAAGYPRVEMNGTGNLFAAYQNANSAIRVVPSKSSGTPAVEFFSGGNVVGYLQDLSPILAFLTITGQRDLQIGSGKTLYLTANNGIEMSGTSLKINNQTGYTGSISYVKNIVPDGFGGFTANNGTLTFTNGVLTSAT